MFFCLPTTQSRCITPRLIVGDNDPSQSPAARPDDVSQQRFRGLVSFLVHLTSFGWRVLEEALEHASGLANLQLTPTPRPTLQPIPSPTAAPLLVAARLKVDAGWSADCHRDDKNDTVIEHDGWTSDRCAASRTT